MIPSDEIIPHSCPWCGLQVTGTRQPIDVLSPPQFTIYFMARYHHPTDAEMLREVFGNRCARIKPSTLTQYVRRANRKMARLDQPVRIVRRGNVWSVEDQHRQEDDQ